MIQKKNISNLVLTYRHLAVSVDYEKIWKNLTITYIEATTVTFMCFRILQWSAHMIRKKTINTPLQCIKTSQRLNWSSKIFKLEGEEHQQHQARDRGTETKCYGKRRPSGSRCMDAKALTNTTTTTFPNENSKSVAVLWKTLSPGCHHKRLGCVSMIFRWKW